MEAYLRVDDGELPLDGRAEVYRQPEADHRIVVAVGGTEYPLSLSDPTVSRREDGGSPIVIDPRERWVEVVNNGNENGVTIATSEGTESIRDGFRARIERDATIEIGVRTRLQLIVERTPCREEYTIHHEGDGDVVVGDKTDVDDRTSVGDSNVIKGDIGSGEAEGNADAAGAADTTYCERHDRSFTGNVCPDCARQLN